MHPLVAHVRAYCEDYVAKHDFAALETIIEPDYRLHVGGFHLVGRDETYIPTMTKAFQEYPDFGITVHDLFTDGAWITMRFSLHSTSASQGTSAVWSGVVLYTWNGSRITEAWAEEDFFGRRRQIRSAERDPMEAPHPDPWSTTALPADEHAADVVRAWLTGGSIDDPIAVVDDRHVAGQIDQPRLAVSDVTINAMCSVSGRVGFHATQDGVYEGGFVDLDQYVGQPCTRGVSGVAEVTDGEVRHVRVFTDRLELSRRLSQRTAGVH